MLFTTASRHIPYSDTTIWHFKISGILLNMGPYNRASWWSQQYVMHVHFFVTLYCQLSNKGKMPEK